MAVPAFSKAGFTLVEVLVSLGLVGVLAVIAAGFILPLQLTRTSAIESQALGLARSYLEVAKEAWLRGSNYSLCAASLPAVGGTTSQASVKMPASNWSLVTTVTGQGGAACQPADTLRTISVAVTAPGSAPVRLSTLVARP